MYHKKMCSVLILSNYLKEGQLLSQGDKDKVFFSIDIILFVAAYSIPTLRPNNKIPMQSVV